MEEQQEEMSTLVNLRWATANSAEGPNDTNDPVEAMRLQDKELRDLIK